jgi:tRNA(adenine34) deaminase
MSSHGRALAGASALHSRRTFVAAFFSTAAHPLFAATLTPASTEDERFMRMALDEARRSDFPFGAVIIRDGRLLARGRNLGRTNNDPTARGDMVAIRRCLLRHGSKGLRGSTLYTTARCAGGDPVEPGRAPRLCRAD